MNNMPQRKLLARICIVVLACQLTTAMAEQPDPVEIQSNDTLSAIVVKAFPGYGNRRIIMQAILEKNPQAFINNDINRLIVGRTLQFPDVSTLSVTSPVVQTAQQSSQAQSIQTQDNQDSSARAAVLAQLTAMTEERDKLSATLEKLETENRFLQSRVEELEQLKTQQDEQLTALDGKIKALQLTLANNQKAVVAGSDVDQAELAKLKSSNEAVQTELQAFKDESKTAQAALGELQSSYETVQAELEKQQAENAGLQAENIATQTELSKLQQTNTGLQAGDKTAQAELDKLQETNTGLQAENKQLTQQLAETQESRDAASKENSVLQQQITTLKADAPEVQQQLEALLKTSETLKADNTVLNEQLSTVREQLNFSQKNADALRAELADLDGMNSVLKQDLAALNLENSDLQSGLDAANQQNTTLETEMAQINAAAANDVDLVKKPQPAIDLRALWPWLLALLLLPIAWLLGRRSHPIPETTPAVNVSGAGETGAIPDNAAKNDPVIPTVAPGELDDISQLNVKSPAIPENPDAGIKLDMARAYLDLRDSEAANDMLAEVMREGGTQQQQEAREIRSFLK